MACFINNPAKAFPKPRTPREVPAWKYKSVLLVQEYHDPYGGPSHLMFSHNNKVLQGEEMLTRNAESIAEVIYKFHSASGYSKFPVHVFNYGEVLEKGQDAVRPLYTVTVDDYDRYMKEPEKNPLFLPKSLFDSYIVKSTDGSITVDRIQTIAGAERKVRELAKRYPCVGFDIKSAKHGGVVKAYAAAVGKAPKVTTDNTRDYKRRASEEARESTKWNLRIDGKDYADYDSRGEAEREGKRVTKADGGRWSVRQVRGNPSPTNLTGNAHLDTLINEWRASGRLAFVYPKRKEVSLNGGSAKSYATTLAYLKECKQREKNPLTGVPSHDIPLLRRERYPRGQAVAIALEEHRRRGMGNPGPHGVPPKIKERGVALGRLQEHLAKYPADRTASRNAVGWDYEIGVWPNRVEMAGFIRKQQQGTTKQWKPVVKLGETEGYSRPVSNPEYSDETQAAADLYESFHGTPSTGEVEYVETYDVPDIFAELGDLIELKVATIHGKDAVIAAPDPDGASLSDIVKLVSSPDGRQLYFLGGDQGLDLQKLGFAESEERHRMLIGVLYELTYQTKKKFHKLKTTQYYHGLGEETGNQPVLVYDPYNERMSVVGGDYHVKPEGIVN